MLGGRWLVGGRGWWVGYHTIPENARTLAVMAAFASDAIPSPRSRSLSITQ
jgi:hypothetical protein